MKTKRLLPPHNMSQVGKQVGGALFFLIKVNTVRPPLRGNPRDFENWPLNRGTIEIG